MRVADRGQTELRGLDLQHLPGSKMGAQSRQDLRTATQVFE
jgi:hypothetical protein